MATISIFGAGMMGEAMLAGLLRDAGAEQRVLVAEKRAERAEQLRARYGVEVVDNATAAAAADFALVIVKPQDVAALLAEIGPKLPAGAVVVSLAAGLTTAYLAARLPDGQAVVRVMPNTPALVGQGMSVLSAGANCSTSQLAAAEALLGAVGKTAVVEEKLQDAVTAVSGSGPAYIFYVVEAMVEAGVVLGLTRATAHELVVQTVLGAATMLDETNEHPSVLRENVTSPGGTTAAALRQLDDHKVRAAFITAMEAARDRSKELAAG